MIKDFAILFIMCFLFSSVAAQVLIGKWKTIDDDTGEAKSIVEIYETNGEIYGKIIGVIDPKDENSTCGSCEGENKDKPIVNMVIIKGLTKEDDVYEGGTILNPENGKVYKCRLKLEDTDLLQVRGYLAFFYKTQYWKRIK